MAKRRLKFGSPAWRKKYMKKNRPKRKRATARRTNRKRTTTRRSNVIRKNPPRKWTNVKAVRVVKRGGRDILEIRK